MTTATPLPAPVEIGLAAAAVIDQKLDTGDSGYEKQEPKRPLNGNDVQTPQHHDEAVRPQYSWPS